MNKVEFETILKNENLLPVYNNGVIKTYVSEEDIERDDRIKYVTNIFGIYKEGDEFVFFINDCERGVSEYAKYCDSKEAAYNAMYSKIVRLKYIHDNGV